MLPVALPAALLRLLVGPGWGGVSVLLSRGRDRLMWVCMSSKENNCNTTRMTAAAAAAPITYQLSGNAC
jgi:hypothetical protein